MAKRKTNRRTSSTVSGDGQELDGVYLLKLVLYVLLGSVWLKINHGSNLHIPIPVGLLAGLLFASHDHFRIDRKIEYAVLLVAMLIGYIAPYGLYVSF